MADEKPKTLLDTYRPALAEFFAMTLFVWCGCGTAVSVQAMPVFNSARPQDTSLLLSISVAFGFAIAVLVYTIAPISGGHINPAVTYAFVVSGKMSMLDGLRYIIAQCLGAFLGASIIWGGTASDLLTVSTVAPFNVGMNSVNPSIPNASAFLGECMGTFLLVFTVIMTAVHPKSIAQNIAPVAIGWSVLLAHLVLIPLTGCGINPARSLGPMLVVLAAGGKPGLSGWWVFYTAPFIGSGAAVLVTKYIFGAFDDIEEAEAEGMIFEKESRAAQAAGAAVPAVEKEEIEAPP